MLVNGSSLFQSSHVFRVSDQITYSFLFKCPLKSRTYVLYVPRLPFVHVKRLFRLFLERSPARAGASAIAAVAAHKSGEVPKNNPQTSPHDGMGNEVEKNNVHQ